jgi:hypothetical protein
LIKPLKAPAVASDSIEPLDVENTTEVNTEVYLRRLIYKFLLKKKMYASLKLSPGKKHETSGKMCCEQYIAPRRKETNIYPNAQTQASRLPNPHFTPSNSSEKYHCSIAPETELAQGSEFLKMNSQKTEFLKLFPDESQCAAAQRIFRTNRTFENFALLKELVRTSSYHVDVYVCQTF